MEYVERTRTVEVPKGSGVPGFLRAIEKILKKPRLQSVQIDGRGLVTYNYFARADDDEQGVLEVAFDDLMPYAVVRTRELVELVLKPATPAPLAISEMFFAAQVDHLHPAAWVLPKSTRLWAWFERDTGVRPPLKDSFFGLPVMEDRSVDDHALILCAGFRRDGTINDTQKSYKISLP